MQLTIARPYAKAVFAEAKANSSLASWKAVLHVLALIGDALQQAGVIGNPSFNDEQKHALCLGVLHDVVADALSPIKARVDNFIRLLVQDKRLAALPGIEQEFLTLLAASEEVVTVEVVSAYELSDAQKQQLKAALQKRFNANITIEHQHDETLIGGVVLRAGNWVLDGSVRGKLTRLSDDIMA